MAHNEEERLARIIDLCLNQVASGQETIDSVLNHYPDLADTLRPQLKAALWLEGARQTFDPRPAFIQASQRRLINRIQQEAVAQKRAQAAPLSFWERWFPVRRHAFQFALALLLMILLVFSGETVALAARGAIPGDTLYPVKLAQEKAQLALTLTGVGDARLHTRFANRRLMEIEGLIVQGRYDRLPAAVADYEEQVGLALLSLEQILKQDPAQGSVLAAELQEVLAERTQDVTVLAANLPPSSRSQVVQVLVVSEQSLETVETLVSENGGQLPTVVVITPTGPSLISPEPSLIPSGTAVTTLSVAPFFEVTLTSPPTETPLPSATPLPSTTATLLSTPTLNPTQVAATLAATVSPTPRPAIKSPPVTDTPEPEPEPEVRPTRKPKPTKEPKPTKDPARPPNPPGRTPKPN
jgi:hypothetical protein